MLFLKSSQISFSSPHNFIKRPKLILDLKFAQPKSCLIFFWLQDLEKEESEAEDKLKNQKAERAKLEREEHKYWKEYSRHKRQLLMGI